MDHCHLPPVFGLRPLGSPKNYIIGSLKLSVLTLCSSLWVWRHVHVLKGEWEMTSLVLLTFALQLQAPCPQHIVAPGFLSDRCEMRCKALRAAADFCIFFSGTSLSLAPGKYPGGVTGPGLFSKSQYGHQQLCCIVVGQLEPGRNKFCLSGGCSFPLQLQELHVCLHVPSQDQELPRGNYLKIPALLHIPLCVPPAETRRAGSLWSAVCPKGRG